MVFLLATVKHAVTHSLQFWCPVHDMENTPFRFGSRSACAVGRGPFCPVEADYLFGERPRKRTASALSGVEFLSTAATTLDRREGETFQFSPSSVITVTVFLL